MTAPKERKTKPPRRNDPVTAYAQSVVDGRTLAGRAVRLACQRHLRDLERQGTRAFPYMFNAKAAQHAIDFFPEFLTVESGAPFHLVRWLKFCVGSLFGWKRADGTRRFRFAYISTSKGSGKALALDTPIPTPGGWATMGGLQVGDQVFDERGRAVNIVATSEVMAGRTCYEVAFDDGSVIVADAEHLWLTECRRTGAFGDGVRLAERGQSRVGIRTTEQIRATLRNSNGKYQSANHSVPLTAPLGLPSARLPIDPYALGVWLGDGDSDCARVTVGDQDIELLEHLEAVGVSVSARQSSSDRAGRYRLGGPTDVCGRGHSKATEFNGTHCRACERERDRAQRRGIELAPAPATVNGRLRAMGVLDNKHVPGVYLRASVEQRLALLQGLMDTDGSIVPESGECEFIVTDERLAKDVHELIISLGIKCRIRESAAKLYGREVSRRWRMQFHPPHDLPVFRLRRKVKWQVQRHTRRRLSGERRIVDVRPVDSVPVKCITVDGPSSLYLAGRAMIPTHNSPTLAGVGLYCLAFDGEPAAEIYSVAYDKGQASIILNDAIRMSGEDASPELHAILTVGKYNIAHEASNSFFRAMSSEHRSKSGPRPYVVLIDELHEHRDGNVVNKMIAGFKFRTQPLAVAITNAGADRTSICWDWNEKSLKVVEGSIVDEEWFGYVCQLDPCQKHYDEGYRQPHDGCKDCDSWTDPAVWPKVNPALDEIPLGDYLESQVKRAESIPSEMALVKRLNFSLWTKTNKVWIPPERWDACKVERVSDSNPEWRPCTAGLDLSSKHDLTALTIAMRFDDVVVPEQEPAEEVEIEGIKEDGERGIMKFTLDFTVELIPFAWLPQETLIERSAIERIPYDVWERLSRESGPGFTSGKFFVTPQAVIDHQAIYDFIVHDAWKRFRIQRIAYDPHDATMLSTMLRDRGRIGDEGLVALGQGKKLSEAFKLIEVLVRARRLRHDGNPVLAWCFANAEPQRDRLGALWIEKPNGNETMRIDLAVGAAMAIHQLMLLPSKRKRVRPAKAFFMDGWKEIGRDEPRA